MPNIQISKPQLDPKELKAIAKVLRSGQLAQGELVAAFEGSFDRYYHTKHSLPATRTPRA